MAEHETVVDHIESILQANRFCILDGGLATELEHRGYSLDDELWSARLLLDDPDAISQLHYDYFAAGADCVITASYQATVDGLVGRGLSKSQAAATIARSVTLAVEAREQMATRNTNEPPRLIAASIGPYGAALHNGAEYRGDYHLSAAELRDFHTARFEILAESKADLLACETIPNFAEADVLLGLLEKNSHKSAWFSFTARDESHIADGTPIAECVKLVGGSRRVVAVGVNCVAPALVVGLIENVRSATDKPIIVYPNSGESWNARSRCWQGERDHVSFAEFADEWHAAGASIIGGCCRTGVNHIRELNRLRKMDR